MTDNDFEACPFCDSTKINQCSKIGPAPQCFPVPGTMETYCEDCGASTGEHQTWKEAAEAWNKRGKLMTAAKRVLESVLAQRIMKDEWKGVAVLGAGAGKTHLAKALKELKQAAGI